MLATQTPCSCSPLFVRRSILILVITFNVSTGALHASASQFEECRGHRCDRALLSGDMIDDLKTLSHPPYRRDDYAYKSYGSTERRGFYTNNTCRTNIDHLVALKDAHLSGGHAWSLQEKSEFANDQKNHVSSCAAINSSKGASTPADFLRKSQDHKGLDYKIVNFCEFLRRYRDIKESYGLSFRNNDLVVFDRCGLSFPQL